MGNGTLNARDYPACCGHLRAIGYVRVVALYRRNRRERGIGNLRVLFCTLLPLTAVLTSTVLPTALSLSRLP